MTVAPPSIRLVVPHFGPRPSFFPLVVRSMARNPDVHWLLLTDEPVPDPPPNLDVRLCDFESLAKRIRAHARIPAGREILPFYWRRLQRALRRRAARSRAA